LRAGMRRVTKQNKNWWGKDPTLQIDKEYEG